MVRFTIILLLLSATALCASPSSAELSLHQADEMADLYNWVAATPLYAQAELGFNKHDDAHDALHAHIGYLRATMETRSLRQLSQYFGSVAIQPLVKNDPYLQIRCYVAKADVDAEIDSAPARADWEAVRRLAEQLHDPKWRARATGEIGFAQFVQGDHAGAQTNTTTALLYAHRTGDFAAEIRFLSGIGTGIVLGGGAKQAIAKYLDPALRLATKHPETGWPYMAVAGKIMGLLSEQNMIEAQSLIQQQIQHAAADHRTVKFTQAKLFEADIAIAQGKRADAIQILENTAATARHNGSRLLTECYAKLSNLYRQQGDLRNAEKLSNAALERAGESKDMYLAPELLLTLARLRIAQHDTVQADHILTRATDIVEGMLAHTAEPRTREGLLTTMSKVYAQHFALAAHQRNNVPQAYSIIERVRGRLISELLVNNPRLKDLDELNSITEDKLTSLKLQLVQVHDEAKRQTILRDLFYAEQSRWAKGNATEFLHGVKASLPEFRRSLQPNEVLLEYVLDNEQSYCLLLSRSEARLVRLAGRKSVDQAVDTLRTAIIKEQSQSATALQKQLYGWLITPLGNLKPYEHVIVVPDASLHLLPFGVLFDDSMHQYFGFEHTITYAPSAGTEFILRSRRTPSKGEAFLGIAGVPYSEFSPAKHSQTQTYRGGPRDDYDLSQLRDLPESINEVTRAAQSFGVQDPKLLTGKDTTKTAFEQANPGNYQVIHFALHTMVNPREPADSAILLRADPPKADGFLDAQDISAMKLNSQLVVLSACETAVGPVEGEEGIANLSRAFLIAGSSSVVSTLWKIDDTFSLDIMQSFYHHLAQGEEEGRALRDAKMDLLEKFGSSTPPYYWAAFILTGDGSIRLKPNQPITQTAAITQPGHPR